MTVGERRRGKPPVTPAPETGSAVDAATIILDGNGCFMGKDAVNHPAIHRGIQAGYVTDTG
jgi:hypothetical protein